MSKQWIVRQVPQSGAIVGHGIDRAGQVAVDDQMTMETLMQGTEAQKMGRRTRGSGGTFALPPHGSGVVVELANGVLPNVSGVGEDIQVGHGAGQLKVAVGCGASRIVVRDKSVGHIRVEALAPQQGVVWCTTTGRDKLDAAHASAGGVGSPEGLWRRRHDLGEPCGSMGELRCEPAKVG